MSEAAVPANDPTNAPASLALPSFLRLYWLTALVALLVALDLAFWLVGLESYRNPLGWNLSFLAAVIGGSRFVYHAVSELLEGRFGTDLALALAVVAALLLNERWVAAEVVLIALLGESLEALTFRRTQRELKKLLELQPAVARTRRDGDFIELPLDAVLPQDLVAIRPGERIPVDGVVVAGSTSVDQSTLTGESIPVDKEPGSEVFAGTLNQLGGIEVRVERVGEQSALGQVLRIVAAARKNKAHVERLVDQLARYFLPVVLALAAGTFLVTNAVAVERLVRGESLSNATWEWMPTLAVLVVSCPCALVLATPAAMLAALAWLARRGVLVTGGAALERLANVTHLALDKTGTLTTGALQVAELRGVDGTDAEQLLRKAAAAEQLSEHLIARAVLTAARGRGLEIPRVSQFSALPGAGVEARLPADDAASDATLVVGNRRLLVERGMTISDEVDRHLAELEGQGLTPLLVSENGRVLGLLGVGDAVRAEAREVVLHLRRLGLQDVAVLSGDRPAAVRNAAQAVGIDRYAAELKPVEKANWLADWGVGSNQTNQCVAMVGDGVNDAPALATADVGIALRSVGPEIAAEAGDVILMGEPLKPLPGIIALSRETVRVIYQNIVLFAFAANGLGILLTAWLMPAWSPDSRQWSPVAAALFHQVGSVLVLINAMRLLWFESWRASRLGRLESWAWETVVAGWQGLGTVRSAGRWLWQLRFPLLRLAALGALALYLTQIVVFVQPDEVAVVKRFGRAHAILPPGAHLRLPPPFDAILREQPERVRTVEIGFRRAANGPGVDAPVEWNTPHAADPTNADANESLLMTGDRSLVELAVAIQYRVADVKAFRFGSREPERVLGAVAESVVREAVAVQPLLADATREESDHELLSRGRGPLESRVRERLQARANELGLGIEVLPSGVCLRDVHPPQPIVDAFRDVSSAFKERERMKNEADAYRRDKLIQAGGELAWQELAGRAEVDEQLWSQLRPTLAGEAYTELAQAEAFALGRQELAAGDADDFAQRQAVHAQQPHLTEWRLFMDALAVALADKPKLLLDRGGDGRRHLYLGMPPGVSASPAVVPLPLEPEEE